MTTRSSSISPTVKDVLQVGAPTHQCYTASLEDHQGEVMLLVISLTLLGRRQSTNLPGSGILDVTEWRE